MKVKKISEIFEIIRGFSFKQALVNEPDGEVLVVQSGNIKENMEIDLVDAIKIKKDKVQTGAIVRSGDVILSSRGNLKAGLANKELDGAIASASTFILRAKNKEVLSEYAASYFNSFSGQASLKKASLNISITALSAADLSEIEIPIPTIEEQKFFVSIYRNKVRQKELLEQKIKLIDLAMEGVIKKIIE